MRFLKQRRDAARLHAPAAGTPLDGDPLDIHCGRSRVGFWLVNFFFGGLFYLQSEGLVLGEPGVVAAEFTVTVRDIPVQQGESVKKGQVAAIVSSQNVAETIARLTADIAARESPTGRTAHPQLGGQRTARSRAKPPTDRHRRTEAAGDAPVARQSLAKSEDGRHRHGIPQLSGFGGAESREAASSKDELDTLSAALAEAESAIGDLRKLYDNGRLRVPIDGVVSRIVANKGSVMRAGEPLVELYGTKRFVLGYRADRRTL